ncbi:MAG TPA: AMP-binding protein [Bryobacteraceae bacterium]|nr:AMP-binding protein [Bryobacteraceae bacterium]
MPGMMFGIDEEAKRAGPALIDAAAGETWTYGRLVEEVRRRRDALGAPRKALVFHFCGNTLSAVAWYLAALEAGHAIALAAEKLDPSLRGGLLAAFRPEFVVLSENPGPEYAGGAPQGLWRRAAEDVPGIHPDLAIMLPTSGSTGSPRYVRLTRRNVEANAASIRQALGLSAADRPIAHLPLYYSYGLSVVNSHLNAGAATVLTSASLIAAEFWKKVAEQRVSSFSGVPYTYQMLRRLDIDKLPAQSISAMTQAGGKLDEKSVAHFHARMAARDGSFWVMYGQTEATARIAVLPASMLPEKLGTAGIAIPGGSLSVEGEDGSVLGADTPGELVYRGPNVMMGYAASRADLSRGDELHGVLRTGDRGSLDAAGYVTILGRAKRDVKVFGLRINMDDVEAMVKPHGAAAVVGAGDKLIVYCEFGSPAQLSEIRAALSAKLRLHAGALDFRRIAKLPVSASGKIDYAQLETQ